MGLVYLVLLLSALTAMNWRFLGLDRLFSGGSPRVTRRCKWSQEAGRFEDDRPRWTCARCGAACFTTDGEPPRRCLGGDG